MLDCSLPLRSNELTCFRITTAFFRSTDDPRSGCSMEVSVTLLPFVGQERDLARRAIGGFFHMGLFVHELRYLSVSKGIV